MSDWKTWSWEAWRPKMWAWDSPVAKMTWAVFAKVKGGKTVLNLTASPTEAGYAASVTAAYYTGWS